MSVGVIVVSYNTLTHLKRLLGELAVADATPQRLVVLDNASDDGTRQWLKDWQCPNSDAIIDWHVFLHKENTGFTAAVNRGMSELLQHDDIEYIALVNPDIMLCRNWLAGMVHDFTIDQSIGIIGCKQIRGDEVIHAGGYIADTVHPLIETKNIEIAPGVHVDERYVAAYSRFGHRRALSSTDPFQHGEYVPWVTFACAVLSRRMIDDIGLLDTVYFNYASDAEYCIRALRAGWVTYFEPQVTVYHFVGASTDRRDNELIQKKVADLRRFTEMEKDALQLWQEHSKAWETDRD